MRVRKFQSLCLQKLIFEALSRWRFESQNVAEIRGKWWICKLQEVSFPTDLYFQKSEFVWVPNDAFQKHDPAENERASEC